MATATGDSRSAHAATISTHHTQRQHGEHAGMQGAAFADACAGTREESLSSLEARSATSSSNGRPRPASPTRSCVEGHSDMDTLHEPSTPSSSVRDISDLMQRSHIDGDAKPTVEVSVDPLRNPYADRQPHPSLAPEDVIEIQLGAMKHNELPCADGGVEICFRFASPANRMFTGPLPRFARMMHSPLYSIMMNYDSLKFVPANAAGSRWRLTITKGAQRSTFLWSLSKQTQQPYEGCWMTDHVLLVQE